MSAEYIMAGGNENVILCERGIRTFERATPATRWTCPPCPAHQGHDPPAHHR